MEQPPKFWPIATRSIDSEADVVTVRQRAKRIAELLGFEAQDQTRIATAVSEIARNAYGYGGGGRADFLIDAQAAPQRFTTRVSDQGRGIHDLEAILEGRYRSPGGMGLGIVGARRLSDHFHVRSEPGKGTVVEIGRDLPQRSRPISRTKLAEIAAVLRNEHSSDPLAALREQNRELMESLEELRRREDETRELSRELGDTNRGVVALYAELDERAEQLKKAGDLKSRFLSHMSHEFRTPLNSILALSRILIDRLDGELTPEQEKQVGYIRRSAESLLDLVNDLLDLAKVEAGKVEVRLGRFTIPNLFGGLRGALKPLLTSPDVELLFESEPNVPEMYTDEAKVTQILRNLISNALKFTEHGHVRVTARHHASEGKVAFSVEDTGIGISPEDQERIFEEFSQLDSSFQNRTKGTGLGLPLSRSLAELLGGTLTLESVKSQGSVFSLCIPAKLPDDARQLASVDGVRTRRVLLIDDDETFRYVMRQIVVSESNHSLIEAGSGQEGLQIARSEQPDLIVLDLNMPEMDGFTVLQELRADPRTSTIPVVISTSMSVGAELKARLPERMKVIPKHSISRETVSLLLRDVERGLA